MDGQRDHLARRALGVREVARAVANPKIAQQINNLDADPVSNRPDQFQAFIKSEIDKWSKVIRAANIKIE